VRSARRSRPGGWCVRGNPKVIVTATVPSYDAAGMAISMRWKQLVGRVKLAGMAAGGAVVVGMSKGFPPIFVLVLAASVGIGFLWLYFYKAEVDRCIILARAEILPEVDRAFVDGRYVFRRSHRPESPWASASFSDGSELAHTRLNPR